MNHNSLKCVRPRHIHGYACMAIGVVLAATVAPQVVEAQKDRASFTASKSVLMLDGQHVGYPRSVAGGAIAGDVVTVAVGPEGVGKKHLAGVKYEEIILETGLESRPLIDWIAQSWKAAAPRKNGSVVTTDFNYKAQSEREFTNALLVETTIPTFDGASRDAAYFTVKIAPELIRTRAGSGADVRGQVGTKQKAFMRSNFRFELDNLPTTRVAKIESGAVRQGVTTDAVGELRQMKQTPSAIEFPNLKVSFSLFDAKEWESWADDFLAKGNNGDDKEKNGAIVFLSPNMQEELGRINLFNCGIYRLARDAQEANPDRIQRMNADLYCERMELIVTDTKTG